MSVKMTVALSSLPLHEARRVAEAYLTSDGQLIGSAFAVSARAVPLWTLGVDKAFLDAGTLVALDSDGHVAFGKMGRVAVHHHRPDEIMWLVLPVLEAAHRIVEQQARWAHDHLIRCFATAQTAEPEAYGPALDLLRARFSAVIPTFASMVDFEQRERKAIENMAGGEMWVRR